MKKFRNIILFALLSVIVAALPTLGNTASQQRAKARYYFLEGARQSAMKNEAEAYEYFKKAYMADSTYSESAFHYGLGKFFLDPDVSRGILSDPETLKMMQQYVDDYPADLYATQLYGLICTNTDTIAEAIRVYERLNNLLPKETYILMTLSDVYMLNGDIDKALDAIRKYESIEGKSQTVSIKKINYLLNKKDTVAAVEEVNNLISTNPRDPNYRILKGNLYEIIGDNDSVLASLKDAELLQPDNGTVKMSLAAYYQSIGDSIAYDNKIYEALLSEDFELVDKLGILSDYLQTLIDEEGDKNRGDYLFTVLKSQYPHEPGLLDLSARYSAAKGDFKDAEEQISYAIDQDITNITYWGQLLTYQLADQKFSDLKRTYKRAKEYIDVPYSMKMIYASALVQTEDTKEAIKVIDEVIHDFNPDLPIDGEVTDKQFLSTLDYDNLTRLSSLYNMLGDLYYTENNFDKAFQAYENSLFFYHDNPLTLNNYAYFLTESGGDLTKAREMSEKALALDENNPTYIDTFAWILFKQKEYERALEYQKLALELAEQRQDFTPDYFNHMGDILFMNHEPDEALKYWEKALELDPGNELLKKKVEHKTFFFK